MRFTNSAVSARRMLRTGAIALLPWSPVIWLSAAGDPYQPARALAVGVFAAVLLATGVLRASLGGKAARVAIVALAALAVLYVAAWLFGGVASGVFGIHGRYSALVTGTLSSAIGLAGATLRAAEVRTLARSTAVALLVQSLVVAVQAATGARTVGSMGNGVLLGSWLAVALVVVLALSRGERSRWTYAEYAAVATGSLALGLAGSRGAWVGVIAGVVVIVVMQRDRVRLLLASALVGALVLVGALALGGEVAAKLDPASLTGGSAASRLEIWRGTGQMVAEHPVLGIGPGRFLYEFPAYEPLAHARIEGYGVRVDQAHSLPLQLAAEAGLPAALVGLALFGAALVTAWRGARGRSAAALICLAGLTAFGAQGVFGISTVETDALAWLLGGAAFAVLVSTDRDTTASESRAGRATRVAGVVLAVAVLGSSAWYVVGDMSYGRASGTFETADFATSLDQYRRATQINPLVDVYRVGAADATTYLLGPYTADTLASLERGLELEPASYDLAIARARLLADSGADASVVADAYALALRLYPLGLDVRHETMGAFVQADRVQDARELAERVLVEIPDDPVALEVKDLLDE